MVRGERTDILKHLLGFAARNVKMKLSLAQISRKACFERAFGTIFL